MAVTVFMSEGPFTYISIVEQSSGVPVATDVSAEDYLSFAKADLAVGTPRGLINAMGNSKRALHLMIDTIMQNYGLLTHNKGLGFPGKLRLMDQVGLVSLNVFRKLNVERNIVEHEYQTPDIEKIQDFIDVCHLLLLALERLGQDLTYRSLVGIRASGEHRELVLEPILGRLDFRELIEPSLSRTEVFGTTTEYVSTLLRQEARAPRAGSVGDVVLSIELRDRTADEWSHMLRDLVDLQSARGGRRVTRVDENMVTIWHSISLPLDSVAGKTLSELFSD